MSSPLVDLELRTVGFLFTDADGQDPFSDGGFGVGLFKIGDRYFVAPPK